MRLTYDIEVWLPSIGIYKEVSSASWAGDYQARRANIRYRPQQGKGTAFIHTLNASGLATSRLLPAIVEQNQQPDGSVVVPEPLRPWLGTDVLRPSPHQPVTTRLALSPVEDLDRAGAAIDPDPVAGAQAHGGVAAADDGGDAELAGHDRGVRERRADVGHDRGRAGEDRGPADVGDRGDEDLAVTELAAVLGRAQHPRRPLDHPGRAREPGNSVVRPRRRRSGGARSS